jgi:hypothetical protein
MILICVSFRIDVDCLTFLNLGNDPIALWILTLTSVLAPPYWDTTLPREQKCDDLLYPRCLIKILVYCCIDTYFFCLIGIDYKT